VNESLVLAIENASPSISKWMKFEYRDAAYLIGNRPTKDEDANLEAILTERKKLQYTGSRHRVAFFVENFLNEFSNPVAPLVVSGKSLEKMN